MTDDHADDRRNDDRRNGDQLLATHVAKLVEEMQAIDNIRIQVGGDEAIIRRKEEHEQLMEDVPAILDALVGPEDGLTGQRNGGMKADVEKALARQVTRGQVWTLIGTIVTAAAIFLAG